MRTVLLSSVAALALTFATGSLAPASAQSAAVQSPESATAPTDNPAPAMTAPQSESSPAAKPVAARHHRKGHDVEAMERGHESGADHWAHEPGTGESGPASSRSSNITQADTHSDIAPHLPTPAVGPEASPDSLLQAAQAALASHKTGTAQQALEMAETRLLDRSTEVSAAGQPDSNPRVAAVSQARKALASGDTKGANKAIQMALGGAQ